METNELEERKRRLANKIKGFFSEKAKENTSNSETLDARKNKLVDFIFKKGSNWFYFLLLLPVLWLGWFVRTRNIPLLQGKYLTGLDPYFFYRYALTILEKGALPVIDYMRYSPVGYPTAKFSTFSHILVYLYKFFHFFNPSLSQIEWHIIYPPVITIVGFIFFFLFVRELFGNKVALVSTAFLAVIPAYIFRTSAGFADHEAMAMLFMFVSLYFFMLMWKSTNWKSSILFGSISGLFTAAMAATWGGYKYLTLAIGLFVLASVLFAEVKKRNFIGYSSWYIVHGIFASLLFNLKLNTMFFTSFDGLVLFFALIVFGIIVLTQKYKEKLSKYTKYVPFQLLVILLIGFISSIIVVLLNPAIFERIWAVLTGQGLNRLIMTVAESQQPYFLGSSSGWWATFGLSFILLFLGSVFLCFKMFEGSKNTGIALSSAYGFVLFFFIIGRYKPIPSQVIQFFSTTYLFWFFGFIALITIVYLYLYNKNLDKFNILFSTNWRFVLAFVWLLFAILMSRTQNRLLFMLAPVAAIAIGYFVVEFSSVLAKSKKTKILAVILILFTIFAFYSNAYAAYDKNKKIGSGYPGQWESTMNWIRENTSQDAVIAHWWDYGYWTQTMANRTSVGDGGNLMGWDYGLGRYIMTSTNLTETLEYAKTHKVTHILYSEEEIGKYHAFSFIGSDENLDRASTIGSFVLQKQDEVRNGTLLTYTGAWALDEDQIVGNLVLPAEKAYIIGFSFVMDGDRIVNPKAYVHYEGRQFELDITCIYTQDMRLEFESENAIDGCLVLVPYLQSSTKILPFGGAFWTSGKVKDGLFARLYLFGEEIEYFKEVYSDDMQLAFYKGRILGPIKIWEIEYSGDVKTNDKYLEKSYYG